MPKSITKVSGGVKYYLLSLEQHIFCTLGALNNPVQRGIVADDRERTNVLVLAGPGSGKTRVLVHRIAYLVRVRRENPRAILALAYNRHAAVEIRRRLAELIGADARGVIVLTCHALAMRLVGGQLLRTSESSGRLRLQGGDGRGVRAVAWRGTSAGGGGTISGRVCWAGSAGYWWTSTRTSAPTSTL